MAVRDRNESGAGSSQTLDFPLSVIILQILYTHLATLTVYDRSAQSAYCHNFRPQLETENIVEADITKTSRFDDIATLFHFLC